MQTTLTALSNFCGAVVAWLCLTPVALADGPLATLNTLAHPSTSGHQTFSSSLFVIWIMGGIFLVGGGLLAFAPFEFRSGKSDPLSGPMQVCGSKAFDLAWTVIPVLVLVLFLG